MRPVPQAEILENLGESKYRVRVLYDKAQYQSVLSRQQGLIAQLDTKITDAESKADEKEQALDDLGDTYEDAATLLTAAERLQSSRSALDAITKRVSELRTLVESLDAKLEAARSDEDATELRVTELEQEVVTKTAERDNLQSEYDSLVYLRDLYTTECRLDGYEGENCVLAQDYKEQAESKKEELDDAQQALDDAENELSEARDRLSQLRKQISTLQSQQQSEQPKLTKAEGDLVEAQANHDAAFAEYASALMAIRGETIEPADGGYEKQVEKHQKEAADALAKLTAGNEAYQIARLEVDTLKASRKSQQTRLKAIEKTETGPELECWTSAWNDTLEVGEEVEVVLIPGEATGAVIHETDLPAHRLTPSIWQTPAQCLFNYMMLPGWQRWQYRFGTGTVTADPANDEVELKIDKHPSSIQSLRTDRSGVPSSLKMSPVMGYAVDDRVLIEYLSNEARVVGWYIEPGRPWTCIYCNSSGYYEYTSVPAISKTIIESALAGTLLCRWRRNQGSWVSMTIAEAFFTEDGDGTLVAFSYGDEYPGLFMDYIKDEYSFVAMQALFESASSHGVYEWQITNTSTGETYLEVAFLLDSQLENGVRGKSTPPIERTGGGLPIEVLEMAT